MTESLTKQIKNLNKIIEDNRQQVQGSFSSIKNSITPLKIIATVVGGACLGYFLFTKRAKFIAPLKKSSKAVTNLVTKYPSHNFFKLGFLNALMLFSGFSRYFHLMRAVSSLLSHPRKVGNKVIPLTSALNRDDREGVTLH